jgi:hypothetical protein
MVDEDEETPEDETWMPEPRVIHHGASLLCGYPFSFPIACSLLSLFIVYALPEYPYTFL